MHVDVFRRQDFSKDIKTALDTAKKLSVKTFKKSYMDEEEFRDTGGMDGYIARAQSLLLRKKTQAAKG